MIHLSTPVRDTRGVALPLALVSLLLFSSLALALLAVARTEPTIASNHLRAAQARALAESGIARTAWALGETGVPASPGPFALGDGGRFTITITGADPHARVVRSVGVSAGGARATVVATVVRVRDLARDAPCALCIGAPVTLADSVVDARGSEATDCGAKPGVASAGAVTFGASSVAYGGGAPDGAPAPLEGRDWRRDQPPGLALSAEDLLTLRALAVLRGGYVRPASDAPVPVTDVPHGLVFVDAPANGPPGTPANVTLGPARLRGWIVVNGNVALGAGADLEGVLYAVNAVTTGGPASVTGVVIAQHALGGDSTLTGLAVRFDCATAQAAALAPRGWFVRPGTYCDGTAGC